LQGQSWYEPEGAEAMQFVQGYTTISRFMRCNGQRRYPAKSTVRQVRLSINRSWFESHLGETYSKQFFGEEGGVKVLSQQPTTVSTLHIAKRLASLSLEEALNRLELHSLAISLVRSELGLLLKSLDSKDDLAMFSPQEQQRIQQLRSWMQQNCHLALTVADLAKQAGINEHKLKQGFQVIFQQSPYQLLTELRMAKAYELLLNSEMSVDQIAEAVGYRHGSNFSAAFKKYFELSPGQVKKAQKTEQGLSFLPPP
jgi:AraC-like DNA-binding protein